METHDHQNDGKFDLFYKDGYAHLVVYPPGEKGLPVYPEEVRSRMKLLGIPRVRIQTLIEIIETGASLPVRLVEWPEGVLLSSQLTITVSDDSMEAEAVISAPKPGGGELSVRDVFHELDKRGICSGIDERMINRVLSERMYGTPFLIATGKQPVSGRESIIEFNFETERHKPFQELQYGRINLKELNFIQNCQVGDILAELKPAVPAENGFDIFGKRYEAETQGEPAQLRCGRNARIEANRIIAEIKGNVILNKGIVEVEELVTVENIDYETGNIDFDGSVEVKGTIADGFTLKATGDIQIGKAIGRSFVDAGRSVILKAGVNGDKEGKIHCGGNLLSRYIESCSVSSEGDIFVEEVVMNSQLDTPGSLILTGNRAELIGGLAIVGKKILCRKIGNLYDAKTILILGIEPKLIENFQLLKKALENSRERLDKLDEQRIQLKTVKPADREGAVKILKALDQIEADTQKVASDISARAKELQILRERIQPDPKSYILAEDRVYSGTRISFGLQDHPVPDKGISSSVIYRKGRDILEVGYNRARPELPEELEQHDK
ncbi:DUF342 domain-containing protein [Spirochaeta isovalerica]|uniref:Flagellar Assembly Protein A N-terminal region domain-containing protein n=1 Tax=Spirochaeta isovalerica TaxID=150 RepID=A0A841R464_9SPIO|nr:FapA family protein [Spirochaeta isovalerica]MBB6478655.1 hypothetical protein [Spirochaeta isovalerica]